MDSWNWMMGKFAGNMDDSQNWSIQDWNEQDMDPNQVNMFRSKNHLSKALNPSGAPCYRSTHLDDLGWLSESYNGTSQVG